MVFRYRKKTTMTRRYRKRPVTRRRPVKRTYVRRRKGLGFTKDLSICNPPRRLSTRLVSNLTLSIAPGSVSNGYVFPILSCTDPYGSNGVNQPKGWDRLAQLYLTYQVFSGVMYWTFTNETSNQVSVVTYFDNESTNTSNSIEEARQMEAARTSIATEATGARNIISGKRFWNTKRQATAPNSVSAVQWQNTSETGSGQMSNGGVYLHINFYSVKSSNAANVTGVLSLRLFQNVGFASLQDISVDTTND